MIRNPVLRGFNPDPSIVRVGRDYYLATSTMVWQPGIRLFHSTDLARWSLVGHGLRAGEHELRGLATHQGIWAPCLTYSHAEGLFSLTYSLVRSTATDYFDVDNFLVTASDIRGPGAGRSISTVSASIPRSSTTRTAATGSSPWSGTRGRATSILAPSCWRSSTPPARRCLARAPASPAGPPIAAAWRRHTSTGGTGSTT